MIRFFHRWLSYSLLFLSLSVGLMLSLLLPDSITLDTLQALFMKEIYNKEFFEGNWFAHSRFSALTILSSGLGLWVAGQMASSEKKIIRMYSEPLDRLAKGEVPTSPIPKKALRHQIETIAETLEQQRTSLKKITEERVIKQDALIEERLVAERQRLARELHDSVSQQLFAASMLLSALTEETEEPLIHQIEQIVQQAQLEMRALLLHLRPAALHDRTFTEGMEQLLSELQQKVNFDITFELEAIELSKGTEDHLFRIAQETLSNTLRHAKATEVHLLFIERDQYAILKIQDNGVGFEQEHYDKGSYGLKNVKERAIEIGATYKIVSVPSQGTIVEVKVPTGREERESDDSSIISRRS